MLQSIMKNIKMNGAIFILLGIFLLLAGGLYWTASVANVNYRCVPVLHNFLKLAGYALILPFLLVSSLCPFLKRFPRRFEIEKEHVSFLKRPLSFMQLTTGMLFLASFLIGSGIVSAVNSLLDRSPVRVSEAKVLSKQIWNTRHGREYILAVTSWPRVDDKRTNINLSRIEYERLAISPGDFVCIGIGHGALGIDWVASITKEAPTIGDKLRIH